MDMKQFLEALKNFTIPNTLYELQEQLQALEEYAIALLDSVETEEDEVILMNNWDELHHRIFTCKL